MELIAVFRILRARWLLVAAGFLVAIAVGVLISYRVTPGLPPKIESRDHFIGQGTAQVLIDTRPSQIASQDPADSGSIYQSASELADLMGSATTEQEIATQMGLRTDQLEVTPPPTSILPPIIATSLGVAAQKVSKAPASWQLSLVIDPDLPIIAFSTVAPTPHDAQQLAATAVTVLSQSIDTTATNDSIPASKRLVVDVIGPPLGAYLQTGPKKLYGAAAAVVLFVLICLGIVVLGGRRAVRAAKPRQQDQAELEVPASHAFARSEPGQDEHPADTPVMPESELETVRAISQETVRAISQ